MRLVRRIRPLISASYAVKSLRWRPLYPPKYQHDNAADKTYYCRQGRLRVRSAAQMKITKLHTDQTILRELGVRMAGLRLARNLTQATLAEEAGVSRSTVERLESGVVALQLYGFLRVCRVLDLIDGLNLLVPEPGPSPVDLLKLKGRKRQRASMRKAAAGKAGPWTWGDAK